MRLLLIALVACGCDPAGIDYDFPGPLASDVPFEIPAITAGDSVVVDVGPLFWGEGALRYMVASGDTTVARARMNSERGQTLKVHGLAPGSARVSLMATHSYVYGPPFDRGWSATGRLATRTTTVEIVQAGG